MKNRYWSCSRFADWVRGTGKLKAGTSKQWREWEKHAKAAHPFRWWLAEEGLDLVQDFIYWPVNRLHDLKYYINNRWVTRTHALTAHARDIPRGQWRDVGNRFLPCLFNELVDFVEVELAWRHIAWNTADRDKYKVPFWATGWFRWRTWRCTQAGLDNLEWQRNLRWKEDECHGGSPDIGQLTPQAIAAQEILDLYKWWTEVYRNRPDPYQASGWTAVCERDREQGKDLLDFSPGSSQEDVTRHTALDNLRDMERAYEAEEEEMMIRLIKIRNALWT